MNIVFGSVCSGIEAASVAWHPLGWRTAFMSEIEPFPRAVLKHRFPDAPLHGDFTTIQKDEYEPINLLVGGTPCQSFSVAGLRGGMADDRGNLALEFCRLAQRLRPRWLVWENVPGVLSSNGGRDFGSILGGLAECGYGFAYRVLDAQHFGVPQRRRRVFVVGHLGDWRRAAAVLFERHSLSGDSTPRKEAGQGITCEPSGIAGTCSSKWAKGSGGPAGDEHYNLIAPPLTGNPYGDHESREGLLVAQTLRAEGFDASEDGTGRQNLIVTAFDCKSSGRNGFSVGGMSPTLRSMNNKDSHANSGGQVAVAFNSNWTTASRCRFDSEVAPTMDKVKSHSICTETRSGVRRLTPRECERLQGFPDDFTLVPFRGKPAADGPRYKALGNSMAVPCMAWIGQRIEAVDWLVA